MIKKYEMEVVEEDDSQAMQNLFTSYHGVQIQYVNVLVSGSEQPSFPTKQKSTVGVYLVKGEPFQWRWPGTSATQLPPFA